MFRLSDDVQVSQDSSNTILLNVKDGQFYSLTEVGGFVLARLRDGEELRAIISELEAQYGEPRQRLAADVEMFVQDLVRKGLVATADE